MNSKKIILEGNFESEILLETDSYLFATKPAGIPVHETKDTNRPDFTRLLTKYLGEKELRTINRLDLGTSGIVFFGKSGADNTELDLILKSATKEYLFLCLGIPEWTSKREECFIKDGNKKVSIVRSGGKKAISEFKILATNSDLNISLGMARIFTGRRHQIRIMLSSLGFPILGDAVYGVDLQIPQKENRMYLHAYRFGFTVTPGEKIIVETSIPKDFQKRMGKTEIFIPNE
ncbi:RNA pseudouridine synthase [Leptospira sp. 96542]|nr:RNA pseudouridine synthase [Leptospira sp. 96542]